MIDVMDAKDLFLSHYTALEKKRSGDPMQSLRTAAIERFAEMGLPAARDEEWRFTPLNHLTETTFRLADPDSVAELTSDDLQQKLPQTGPCGRLVLANGHFAASLSTPIKLPEGIHFGSISSAFRTHRSIVTSHLSKHADYDDKPFVALNTGFLQDGIFIYLPRGVVVPESLHLVYDALASDDPIVCHPRTLIVCEENAEATIIQSYLDQGDGVAFTNAVTEIVLGANARVRHCKLQRENFESVHFETLQIQQDRGSNFSSHAITLGGGLVRNEINAVLAGEGCECTLNGLYVANGRQHIDNRTSIDHAMPHCASHELYKGILDGHARGVFNGKIFVRQDAQKTDAKQTNKTLLLSDDATINTKPQLEIFADDVKCTHGATVGQLAGDAIFYLRSRGIGMEEARAILTYAFADDILQHIPVEPLKHELENHFLAAQQLPPEQVEEAS